MEHGTVTMGKRVNMGIDFDFMRGKAGVGLLGSRGLSMLVDQPTLLSNIAFNDDIRVNQKCKIVVARRGHGGRNGVLINFYCWMAAVLICILQRCIVKRVWLEMWRGPSIWCKNTYPEDICFSI